MRADVDAPRDATAGLTPDDVVGGRRWWFVPVGIFGATRLIDALLLILLGRSQVDPATLDVAPGRPPLETGRSYEALITNWDGQWYRYIVEHGYPSHLPTLHGAVQDNQWAFYPLYPGLVRAVTWTGLSFGVAASLVSITFGAFAMCLLYRLFSTRLGGFGASMSVLALCVAPAGVIWQAAYTESLALFLVMAALASLISRRYGLFLMAALALSLTRPIVLPVAVVAAVHWYSRWRRRETEPFHPTERFRLGIVTVGAGASFLIWPIVAAVATGRADAYFVTQRAWLSGDVRGWPSWILTLVHGSSPALVVLFPVAAATLLLLVLRGPASAWGPEVRAWALTYPLYLLGSTTPTTSIFRYAMLSVVPWWPAPDVGVYVSSRRARWALATAVCLLGICVQVAWMRWFFVIGPAALERP